MTAQDISAQCECSEIRSKRNTALMGCQRSTATSPSRSVGCRVVVSVWRSGGLGFTGMTLQRPSSPSSQSSHSPSGHGLTLRVACRCGHGLTLSMPMVQLVRAP
jgi:hypothetical protein